MVTMVVSVVELLVPNVPKDFQEEVQQVVSTTFKKPSK
jgi:hypothetical protein